uniref:RING-CH-type domain-containing protein n=1 Tax=Panagrolaimus sp. ES5 TaxID=591445 RepID=A0AC34FJG8_9BILA
MATIHENCLNEWVSRSRAEKCEICKESYAQSSKRFRPIREWTKPKITFRHCLFLGSLACLISSLINLYFICVERKFFERVFVRGYPPRGGDSARLVIAAILIIMIACILSILYDTITGYFARQRVVRFIDNPNQAEK